MTEPARRRFRLPKIRREVRWTITVFVLFFVFEYILLPELASARRSVSVLAHVNVAYLLLAVGLEVLALMAYAELTHTVLSPEAPSRFRLFRINMASLAVSHVVPGGTAPGTAVGYRLLTEAGVTGSTAGFGLATQGVGSAVVLNAIFWVSLIISIPLAGFNPLYGIAAAAGVVLIGLFAGTVFLITRGRTRAMGWIEALARHVPFVNPETVAQLLQKLADRLHVLLADRTLLRNAILWAAANWLLDAASLWVFLFAFDQKALFPIDLLVAYGLANILAVIPITPSGLGVVDVLIPATLVGFHVTKNIAILGFLAYRLVNFWLPIPIGGACYLSLRFGRESKERRQRRTRHHATRSAGQVRRAGPGSP
jgi:putative heme transporter